MILLVVVSAVSFISSIHSQQPIYHRVTNRHGANNTETNNAFTCPGNGAITGIKYRAEKYITQIEFVCSSAERIQTFGPYGFPRGKEGEVHCEPGQYISSFLGRVDKYLQGLSVRCRDANTLKGEGTVQSEVIETTNPDGIPFDDLAYSNGARPVGIRMWISKEVDAIQVDYSNQLVELCTDKCDEYKEEMGELRGAADGTITIFACPDQGVVTGVTIQYGENVVFSIQFTCASGLGRTVGERIGKNEGTSSTVNCPPGTFIGSVHGRSKAWLTAFGIRCVEFNETGEVPKFDSVGGVNGNIFDDASFSERGLRPVEIQIHHSYQINAIQVKYGNLPVASNCKVNRIEIVDTSVQALSDGFEVIGVSSATTCESGQRLIKLDYSREVTEEVGIDTTDGGDVNWSDEVSVSASAGASVFGVNVEVSVGLAQSEGGSRSWSTSRSNSSATTTGAASGQDVYYDAPGACIVIGYVDRYTVDRDNVEAKYHYSCQIGQLDSKLTSIKIQSKSYGNAYFEDFQFKYESKEQCTKESRDCVKTLNANKILADPAAFEKAFFDCRPSNSGKTANSETTNSKTTNGKNQSVTPC